MECKTCKYYDDGYCDAVGWHDPEYPHNDEKGFNIKAYVLDDSGLDLSLKVDEDFFCARYEKAKKRFEG